MEIREPIREEMAFQTNLLNCYKDGRSVLCDSEFKVCENMPGSSRGEVFSETLVEVGLILRRDSSVDSDSREIEEPCEACDDEKQSAAIPISNILSVLIHHNEVNGRLVRERRCSLPEVASLKKCFGRIKESFILTDPHLQDMPIVYASDKFLQLTGYSRYEVLGRNCRFLSGVDTDSSTLFQIKKSVQSEQACTVRILNYRKDKSSFWNHLHISPVRNAPGKVAYLVGVQIDENEKNEDVDGMSPKMRHLSTVGAVKVAVRGLSMGVGCSHDQ